MKSYPINSGAIEAALNNVCAGCKNHVELLKTLYHAELVKEQNSSKCAKSDLRSLKNERTANTAIVENMRKIQNDLELEIRVLRGQKSRIKEILDEEVGVNVATCVPTTQQPATNGIRTEKVRIKQEKFETDSDGSDDENMDEVQHPDQSNSHLDAPVVDASSTSNRDGITSRRQSTATVRSSHRSSSPEKNFNCPEPGCDRSFSSKHFLNLHRLECPHANNKFTCKVPGCFKKYPKEDGLTKHLQKTHTKPPRVFHCSAPKCSKSFGTFRDLDSHAKAKSHSIQPTLTRSEDVEPGEEGSSSKKRKRRH